MRFAFGFIIPISFIVFVVFLIRRFRPGQSQGTLTGHSVRRFFQYLLLYGLLVVGAIGVSGLINRLFERNALASGNQTDLARNLSFVVVGVPLFIILALWTRRRFAEDPFEVSSFGWAAYLTLASITSLLFAMFSIQDMARWAIASGDYKSRSLAQSIVWGAIWGAHWWVHLRNSPPASSRIHHMIGSFVSLGFVVVGLSTLISGAVERVWKVGTESIYFSHEDPIGTGFATLVIGGAVWLLYWIRTYSKSIRDRIWLGYVLLVGIGGGLVLAIVSASTVLYSVLVWFFGQPAYVDASTHFRNVPSASGVACVGLIVWWYHHATLDQDRRADRNEIQRIYEYLMSGVGLLAAAGGFAMVLVALVEALTRKVELAGENATNALLVAATLLLVGTPVWMIYWRKIQNAISKFSEDEHSSPTRRIYLFLLFGVGGIVAVVTLLVGVFFVFDDIFKGNLGEETLRRVRFALAILITTGAIAGYHWAVYRGEREKIAEGIRGPRYVLLIGPRDQELAQAITKFTRGRVQFWTRTDGKQTSWNRDEVLSAIRENHHESVLIVAGDKESTVISVDRR